MNPPPLSYRRVLYLAIPIILANLTQPLMSAVDTAVAGHLPGAHHLAGVALGSLLFNLIFWVFGFLRMGTTGVVAQHFGANQPSSVVLTVGRGVLLAVLIGTLILLMQGPLINAGLVIRGLKRGGNAGAVVCAWTRLGGPSGIDQLRYFRLATGLPAGTCCATDSTAD